MAAKPVEKPVKFWKSEKTKLAGCLWSFVARIVIMTITKDRMFHRRIKRDMRSRRCGPYIFTPVLIRAIR